MILFQCVSSLEWTLSLSQSAHNDSQCSKESLFSPQHTVCGSCNGHTLTLKHTLLGTVQHFKTQHSLL